MGALDQVVRQGKALYVGISSYSPEKTRQAVAILNSLGTPCLIHQPSYSMLNRWIEDGLLSTLEELGIGCIAFSALAQGMLTSKYLNGIPEGSRVTRGGPLKQGFLTEENIARIRELNEVARRRNQSLAQMALLWVLRDPRLTSALIGARTVEQLDDSLDALAGPDLSAEELAEIDRHAGDGGIDLWRASSSRQ
jgi:L-glyceraldehyde 3-phosphate reductase